MRLSPSAVASVGVGSFLHRLHEEAAERIARAYAPKSKGPLNTALRHFARFAASCQERTLFKSPRQAGDPEVAAWNEWTFILFATFLVRTPSSKTKTTLKTSTIETYISLLKGHLNFTYDFALLERAPRLKGLVRLLRDEEGDSIRRKRRALRRRHLRRMWNTLPHVRANLPEAVNEHALLSVAWQVLARGGELAPAPARWSKDKHPSRADVTFYKTPSLGEYAVLWLRPLKKKGVTNKIPQIIASYDGGGSDAYAALLRLFEQDPIGEVPPDQVPLFRTRDVRTGAPRHMRVKDMRALVRRRMHELGYESPEQWGAHSCRIGGATDLVAAGDASPLLLQAKGRWASDIGRIYARMTRRSQLAASRLMQRAKGRDLEEIYSDFIQPA